MPQGSNRKQPQNIEAKPTQYRGIQFRSRLEARWAVFLDHLEFDGVSMRWRYEPFVFTIRPSNWQYTPDFACTFHGAKRGWNKLIIEVKPMIPKEEVMALLEAVDGCQSIGAFKTVCGHGSFFNSMPSVVLVEGGQLPITDFFQHHYQATNVDQALATAQAYRFDIHDDLANRKD